MKIMNRTSSALVVFMVMGLAISGCSLSQNLDVAERLNAQGSEVTAAQVNSDLKAFDLSNNGVIDDSEFFRVLDFWVSGGVNTMTFFEVADAWISQADLGIIERKSDVPDKSRIHLHKGEWLSGGTYMIGYPGAVEPRAQVFVRDENDNVGMTIAEFDGSFRFSTRDLPDGFVNRVGSSVRVTQKEDGKSASNPIVIPILLL